MKYLYVFRIIILYPLCMIRDERKLRKTEIHPHAASDLTMFSCVWMNEEQLLDDYD